MLGVGVPEARPLLGQVGNRPGLREAPRCPLSPGTTAPSTPLGVGAEGLVPWSGFLNLETADICGQMILLWGAVLCSVGGGAHNVSASAQ